MSDNPPPVPPKADSPDTTKDAITAYNIVADKIGGLPNLRKRDNVLQAAAIGIFLVIGIVVGFFVGEWPEGVILGAVGGLIVGVLLSGVVLMVIGLIRKP